MAQKKLVAAASVRAWYSTNLPADVPAPGSRGRLDIRTYEAFNKANPKVKYVPASEAQVKTVPVTYTAKNTIGRNYTKTDLVPVATLRALLGEAGKRGRLNRPAAAEAYVASL